MCKGVCFVISRKGKIYSSTKNVSGHESIIKENYIRDNCMGNIVRIEMLPKGYLFSTEREDWDFSVDEKDPPKWFTENKQEFKDKCYNKLWSIIANWKKSNIIEGSLNLCATQIKSLGKLESIEGSLDLKNTQIKTLGNLQSVGGFLDLENVPITTLGSLKSVELWLDIRGTKMKTLGKLERVGTWLNLRDTQIKTLGNLKTVGGDLLLSRDQAINVKHYIHGRIIKL
jgi:hypothetical protein